MSSTHHLLKITLPRAKRFIERFALAIWEPVEELKVEQVYCDEARITLAEAQKKKGKKISNPHHWGKLFDYTWFQVSLPKTKGKRPLYLKWQDQTEATLYCNGTAYFGYDVAHRYAELPSKLKSLWVEGICCQSAIWHADATGIEPEGSRWEGATICYRDELVWQVYHDLLILTELLEQEITQYNTSGEDPLAVMHLLPDTFRLPTQVRQILRRVDDALNAYEREGIEALAKALKRIYKDFPADSQAIQCSLTGHAHVDLVWLWPERIGETKALHSFATVDYLMERYPEYKFGYSQPASYDAVEALSSNMLKRVKKRMDQKRWDANGAMYVESDTLIACGEALARSFVLGQEWFIKHTGKPSKLVWLPDVFGYSASIPQLARLSGAEYFYTNKLNWRQITEFPYTSFKWVGNDGSELLSHIPKGVVNFYNSLNTVKEVGDNALLHQQADIHPDVLTATGYGDGGGGPTDEMCERARRMEDLWGVPKVKWENLETFYERMEQSSERLPKWHGEMVCQNHRGIYTTHGWLKAAFRKTEKTLQAWEAVRCAQGGKAIPDEPWKRIVFAQFHDYIPGSSVNEVYREVREELPALIASCQQAAVKELNASGGEACVFNPLPTELTVYPKKQDRSGALAYSVPPLSGVPYAELEAVTEAQSVKATSKSLENGLLSVRFNAKGEITQLKVRGKAVPLQGAAGGFTVHGDFPVAFDAWDVDRDVVDTARVVKSPATIEVDEESAFCAHVTVKRALTEKSTVVVTYTLRSGRDALEICYDIEWQDRDALLKVNFPTDYQGRDALFAAPFGSIPRAQLKSTDEEQANWEVPASRYAIVCDDARQEGLFVATEDKYGFSCEEGTLSTTLLRTPLHVGEDPGHKRVVPATLRRYPFPDKNTDLGAHHIRIAIGGFDSQAPAASQPASIAETYFVDPINYKGKAIAAGFFGIEGANTLRASWAKPLGKNRWVLRLEETSGRRGEAQLILAKGLKATPCDLLENVSGKALNKGKLSYGPHEIKSYLVEAS